MLQTSANNSSWLPCRQRQGWCDFHCDPRVNKPTLWRERGGSLYKIPLRSLAEIEAPDIFDSLIIPLFSVLSRGLGGWYIFEESSVSMSLNWNIISSKNLPAWWNRETSSCQPHLLSSSHLYVQGFMICVPHVSTRFQMFPHFRTSAPRDNLAGNGWVHVPHNGKCYHITISGRLTYNSTYMCGDESKDPLAT